jgi:hypothetical protein
MKAKLRAMAPALAIDVAAAGGLGMVVYGVHLVYAPAGWILAGIFVVVASALAAAKAKTP